MIDSDLIFGAVKLNQEIIIARHQFDIKFFKPWQRDGLAPCKEFDESLERWRAGGQGDDA